MRFRILFTIVIILTFLQMPSDREDRKVKELFVNNVKNIKILTINLWALPFNSTKTARISSLCSAVEKYDPDVVLLQELWERRDYDTVKQSCKFPYISPYGSFPFIGIFSGMAVLSKYPILQIEKINYPWFENSALLNPVKSAMRIELKLNDKKVSIINTHLTANLEVSLGSEENIFGKIMFNSDTKEKIRWGQLKVLTKYLNKYVKKGHSVILGGDLNTGPRYPLWYKWLCLLYDDYKDLFNSISYTLLLPSTYCNEYGKRDEGQLDHIIAFGKAKVKESHIIFTNKKLMKFGSNYKLSYISDHYGIFSIIAIP